MNLLLVAQYMAAAAFFTVALMHLMVWLRRHAGVTYLFAAITAFAAGTNAIAEQAIYAATDLGMMKTAMKAYVATSGIWMVALIWFVVAYSRLGTVGRSVAIAISTLFAVALVINFYSESSFVYSQLTGLRQVDLPWGERISLAEGRLSPQQYVIGFVFFGVYGLVIAGGFALWRQDRRIKAILFTTGILMFLLFWGTHASMVDAGTLNSPYLSTYAFLIVIFVMSYDLSGEIVRAAELSGQLRQKELELKTAVADERSRIAADLHDSVTQTLFSTSAIAEALPDVWDRHPQEARQGLLQLRQLTKGALAEMRTLLVELRPTAIQQKCLGELLQELAEATAGRSSVIVDVDVDATLGCDLPDDVKVALYRVAQEALNNVVRHSKASNASLSSHSAGGSIIVSISDNGCGFSVPNDTPRCLGLDIMHDRMRAIGGELQIESEIGRLTSVTAHWKDASRGVKDE